MIGLLTTGFYRLRKDEINKHLLTWKISLQVLKEKPITGVGIGNFRKAFGDAQTTYFEQGEPTEQEVALAGNPNCPENDFIQLATGTGIIGILLFIGLIVSVLFSGFRNMDKHPEKLAITGALIAFYPCGIHQFPYPIIIPLDLVGTVNRSRDLRHSARKKKEYPKLYRS